MQDIDSTTIVGECLTMGIPVRIDSKERLANLSTVINYLSILRCRIIVLEADESPKAKELDRNSNIDYVFVKDTGAIFHRTKYINQLLRIAQTEAVAIWDTDVLAHYRHIHAALQLIRQGATIAYPYDGRMVMLSEQLSRQVRRNPDLGYLRNLRMKSLLGRKLCGGAYLVHKQRYLQCGGENEHFTGWSPEDAERLHRVIILGHKACRISNGELFHLYHPRGNNSSFQSKDEARKMREELIKVCSMTPDELKAYLLK